VCSEKARTERSRRLVLARVAAERRKLVCESLHVAAQVLVGQGRPHDLELEEARKAWHPRPSVQRVVLQPEVRQGGQSGKRAEVY
jgi:hypothetical protein